MEPFKGKTQEYLRVLCGVQPNRRTGSPGNRAATDFFHQKIRGWGYQVDGAPFPAMDYVCTGAGLTDGQVRYEILASPYSAGCDLTCEMITASKLEDLENIDCKGKILLLRGPICEEQLMPKNFVFYNPDRHKQIISRLEALEPGGIVTATTQNPELVGALSPFPLFVDGDFDIPSAYCRAAVGDDLASHPGTSYHLQIDARRIPSTAANVIARLKKGNAGKIVITAHIDAYESTPGALDNASGCAVLLLAAEMLADYGGLYDLEITALNGEDHYSAAGQMDYLKRYGEQMPGIRLAINIDDAGFHLGGSSYSFYAAEPGDEARVEKEFRKFKGLIRGTPWFNGDHMIFVQNQVPSVAITSEFMPELLKTVTHTAADTPDLIDPGTLVEIASAISAVVRTL